MANSGISSNNVQNMDGSFYNGHGGNPPMKNDYVTHEELNHAVDKINGRIDTFETSVNGKFELLSTKFDSKFERIPDQLKIALNDYDQTKQNEHKETVHFLFGTIVIGGISTLAGIGALIVAIIAL